MIPIQLEQRRGLTIHFQIVEQIKHLIAMGQLCSGDRLPTVRELAVHLEINPNTVAKAYEALEQQGFIQRKQGLGTFVSHTPKPDSQKERRAKLSELCRQFLTEGRRYGFSAKELHDAFSEYFRKLNTKRRV